MSPTGKYPSVPSKLCSTVKLPDGVISNTAPSFVCPTLAYYAVKIAVCCLDKGRTGKEDVTCGGVETVKRGKNSFGRDSIHCADTMCTTSVSCPVEVPVHRQHRARIWLGAIRAAKLQAERING